MRVLESVLSLLCPIAEQYAEHTVTQLVAAPTLLAPQVHISTSMEMSFGVGFGLGNPKMLNKFMMRLRIS